MPFRDPKRAKAFYERNKEKIREESRKYYQKNRKRELEKARLTKRYLIVGPEIKKELVELRDSIRATGKIYTWNDFMAYLLRVHKDYFKLKKEIYKSKNN